MEMKFEKNDALWAATECSNIEQAMILLQRECELCAGTYPLNQTITMLKCEHTCCIDCAKNYFTIQVKLWNFFFLILFKYLGF